MRRKPDHTVFLSCLVAFVCFVGMGLAGLLPGQCEGQRATTLACTQHK